MEQNKLSVPEETVFEACGDQEFPEMGIIEQV